MDKISFTSMYKNKSINSLPRDIENWLIDCNSAFKAYRKYLGNGYFEKINNSLRNELPLGYEEADIARKMDKIFDTMPDQCKVRTNETVYRGISAKNLPQELLDIITQKTNTDTFVDKGFVSTSRKKWVGRDFMESDGILLKINLPKGSKRIDATDAIYTHMFSNEEEITLPRNSKFRVDSYNPNTKTAKLTYLGQELPLPEITEETYSFGKNMQALSNINMIKFNTPYKED